MFMQNTKVTEAFLKISLKNYNLELSKKLCIAIFIFFIAIIAFVSFAIRNVAKTAHKAEDLQSQLLLERTVNESLTREIQKYSNNIEKIANNLSGEKKSNKSFQYTNITNMLQVYAILHNIQQSLEKIDRSLNVKIKKVQNVIHNVPLSSSPSFRKGIENITIAESVHVNNSSSFVQTASKSYDILSTIHISDISDRIILKKQGLDLIKKSISKFPLRKPVQNGRFVSGFGHRFHPIYKYSRMHNGIDFVAPKGAKILATADGIVEKAIYNRSYGNFVLIKHPNNIKTLYAHMSKIRVEAGQKVKAGHTIGIQGTTGTSTGEHIHYEVIVNNQHRDPSSFIRAKSALEQ